MNKLIREGLVSSLVKNIAAKELVKHLKCSYQYCGGGENGQ
jgi:hypothetical protein